MVRDKASRLRKKLKKDNIRKCRMIRMSWKEEKKYDIIFDDLTDIPLYSGSNMWQFIQQLINQAMTLLPVGKL